MSVYKSQFNTWRCELLAGFNLMFYGLGSKRQLLQEFVKSHLQARGPVMIINGFAPSVNLREIFNTLLAQLGNKKGTGLSLSVCFAMKFDSIV